MDKKARRREQILAGVRDFCSANKKSTVPLPCDSSAIPSLGHRSELLAKPLRGRGYYVNSTAEYQEALAKAKAKILDVSFTDGPLYLRDTFVALFSAKGPNRMSSLTDVNLVREWFDQIQHLNEAQCATLVGLIASGSIRRLTTQAVAAAVMAIKSGKIFVFRGSSLELAFLISDEALVDSESLTRYFSYEDYGSSLRKSLTKKEVGDMDDKELGEAWMDDVVGGLELATDEMKLSYLDKEALAVELEACGMYQFKFGVFDWIIDPTVF